MDWVPVRYYKISTNPNYHDTNIHVNPMYGVWKVSFKDLDEILKTSPLHAYQQRVNDTQGNARESYLIDLRNSKITQVV